MEEHYINICTWLAGKVAYYAFLCLHQLTNVQMHTPAISNSNECECEVFYLHVSLVSIAVSGSYCCWVLQIDPSVYNAGPVHT